VASRGRLQRLPDLRAPLLLVNRQPRHVPQYLQRIDGVDVAVAIDVTEQLGIAAGGDGSA
jgi:hypothetical protein